MTVDDTGLTSALSVICAMKERGWAARFVPARRRFDLWCELEGRFTRGDFDETFFEERVKYFERPIQEVPEWVQSVLVVAIPDPAFRIRFGWHGREVALTVPPTFIHWKTLGEPRVESLLAEIVGERAARMEAAILPRKLLAVRGGLATYGRNNITYVEGMGSYHRLCCLYTDIACEEGTWQEAEALESCASCGACIQACPMHAIDPDRFLVRAELCITYWQEKRGDVPYPAELGFSWQDQFIGCMRCQAVCPHNQGLLKVEEAGAPFTEKETAAFLRGVTPDELPEETLEKLRQHDILDYLEVMPRNLKAPLENALRDSVGSDSRAGRSGYARRRT